MICNHMLRGFPSAQLKRLNLLIRHRGLKNRAMSLPSTYMEAVMAHAHPKWEYISNVFTKLLTREGPEQGRMTPSSALTIKSQNWERVQSLCLCGFATSHLGQHDSHSQAE